MAKESGNKWIDMFMKDEKATVGSMVEAKERCVTASPSLNWSLGGGFYYGHSTCLYGPEGSGKSLIAQMTIGALHRSDPKALAVVNTSEFRAPTPERQKLLGIDPARIVFRKCNTIHDIFDWMTCKDSEFVNTDGTKGAPGMLYMLGEGAPIRAVITDSIKGIRGPRESVLGSLEDDYMMDLSKVLNPCFRAITEPIDKYNLLSVFVQQVNENNNADEVKYQGIKWKVPCGQALKHFCVSMALVERVTKKDSKSFNEDLENISEKSLQTGHTIRVRVEKANMDKPFREAEFKIDYDRGVVETELEVVKMAAGLGVIHHPINPDNQKPIVNQWTFNSGEIKKTWVGFAKALEEISASPELLAALVAECNKI